MRNKTAILCLVALIFSACGTVSTIPIDDAYHWSDETSSTPASVTPATSDTIEATPKTSSVEYLNVQDTTVTVRIKK